MKLSKANLVLILSIVAVLSSFMGIAQTKTAQRSPNIIFILTDDQGWTSVSHHADPNIPESKSDFYETPNMDKLAKMGVLFTQGYAPNPICSPTRNSIMFGQNAARHLYNKDTDWYKKTTDWLTIPRAIKKANPDYKTAHFGKWHIAMEPKDAGFDYDEGMSSNAGGEMFSDEYLDFKTYTKVLDKYLIDNKIKNPTNMRRSGKGCYYWSDENPKDIFGITNRAMKYMKESISEDKPFYVQLSHYAAHVSLISKKETIEYFKNKPVGERHSNPEFAAMLKDLDEGVGKILNFVKEMGIENNTYIFLMGDNGGTPALYQMGFVDENKELVDGKFTEIHQRNFPLRDGKHSFYEGGLRVPFIVFGPGIKAGRVSETPVSGLDFLPTFAELAGNKVEMPEEIDGGSLVPLLHDESIETIERNSEVLIFHQSSHRAPRSAIIKGEFKLIKYWSKETKYENTSKVELFNLANDIGENINLLEKYPKKVKELETELNKFLKDVKAETGERDIEGAFYRLNEDLRINN